MRVPAEAWAWKESVMEGPAGAEVEGVRPEQAKEDGPVAVET